MGVISSFVELFFEEEQIAWPAGYAAHGKMKEDALSISLARG